MKFNVLTQNITDFPGDTLVVNLFQHVKSPGGATAAVDLALGGLISKLIKQGEISGKLGETTLLHHCSGLKVERVIIVGLGKKDVFDYDCVRKAAAAAAKKARVIRANHVGTVVHGSGTGGLDAKACTQAMVEGIMLSLYTFSQYKKPENDHRVAVFSIIEKDKTTARAFGAAIEQGKILAEAQNTARDLINEPANNLTPEKLLVRVKKLIHDLRLAKAVAIQCLDKKALKAMGMEAMLSVAQGSSHEAKFIVLRIKRSSKPLVCLIGKTVTFDSGGISIKPSAGMESMKGDMAGGAVVIGTTLALARSGSKVNLMTLIPAVENMPSGSASRPGDIVRAMNGKTIEIISTDAEGRLTLADAIAYAEERRAQVIIDIATLTGGCQVALGNSIAAVMGNDQPLIDKIMQLSNSSGEAFWQLPLYEEYVKQITSDVADLKNSGGRYASTITAGLFLKAFTEKAKWLHIDVAGKELVDKENFYKPVGGTGFAVRTLYELIRNL
jgi:leucyl aminopeptidase